MLMHLARLAFICLLLIYSAQDAPARESRSSPPRMTGDCVVLLDLDEATGKVLRVRLLKSTGFQVLDEAAIKAFRKARFKPHTRSPVKVPMKFRLQGD